jgi:hypothetical protein
MKYCVSLPRTNRQDVFQRAVCSSTAYPPVDDQRTRFSTKVDPEALISVTKAPQQEQGEWGSLAGDCRNARGFDEGQVNRLVGFKP